MSRCQSWSGRSTRKKPGRRPARLAPTALDQPALAHHAQDALAVDRPAELADSERRDHPVAVGLVLLGDVDDRGFHLIGTRSRASRCGRRPPRDTVDRLAADLGDARHDRGRMALRDELAGPGDALPHSQSRKSFPATSSS
jgi:hypothetical protein